MNADARSRQDALREHLLRALSDPATRSYWHAFGLLVLALRDDDNCSLSHHGYSIDHRGRVWRHLPETAEPQPQPDEIDLNAVGPDEPSTIESNERADIPRHLSLCDLLKAAAGVYEIVAILDPETSPGGVSEFPRDKAHALKKRIDGIHHSMS